MSNYNLACQKIADALKPQANQALFHSSVVSRYDFPQADLGQDLYGRNPLTNNGAAWVDITPQGDGDGAKFVEAEQDWMIAEDVTGLDLNTGVHISLWYKNIVANNNYVFLITRDGRTEQLFNMQHYGNDWSLAVLSGVAPYTQGINFVSAASTTTSNQWNFYQMGYDPRKKWAYFKANDEATTYMPVSKDFHFVYGTLEFLLGVPGVPSDPSFYTDGEYDQLIVYDQAFTENQMLKMYNGQTISYTASELYDMAVGLATQCSGNCEEPC